MDTGTRMGTHCLTLGGLELSVRYEYTPPREGGWNNPREPGRFEVTDVLLDGGPWSPNLTPLLDQLGALGALESAVWESFKKTI